MKQEYHRALEQICLSEEARARIISVLEQKERGLKRPRRRIGRLILVCAVLILLLLGTGAAVVSRVGVLELFFQGDTSQLEPFLQIFHRLLMQPLHGDDHIQGITVTDDAV